MLPSPGLSSLLDLVHFSRWPVTSNREEPWYRGSAPKLRMEVVGGLGVVGAETGAKCYARETRQPLKRQCKEKRADGQDEQDANKVS